MFDDMNRKAFLQTTATATLAFAATASQPSRAAPRQESKPKKGIIFGMLPGALSIEDRFKLAKDVGFDGVESAPIGDAAECALMKDAAEKAGIRVHSVIYGGWGAPMSSPDAATVEKGMAEIRAALHSAKNMGADDILLVPAVVNAKVRYTEAYERSQANIRKLIPLAAELKVMILIEEVWNNFLLSPIEYARYIDEFRSPWVQSYFDIGNVVRFAWPQDWIRTVGKRIKKMHIKDFKGGPGLGTGGQWVNLREGSIDWPEVRRAITEIGYSDFITTELSGGDEAYLRDLSSRLDKILAGE